MKFISDMLRAGLCVLATLILLEFGMRLAGERFQASFYQFDPERGYALRPGAEGWNVGEQENYVRISSRGQHDREHALIRPKNTIRIAIVGDSETEAVQVPLEQAYFSVLERELNRSLPGNVRVEVISFGVGGYGLAPQYLTIKEKVWQYDPQIVLAVNAIDSLILRSSRKLYPGISYGAPFFELHDGKLVLDRGILTRNEPTVASSVEVWSADLMNQFRLLSLVNSARAKVTNIVRQIKADKVASESPYPPDYWKTYGFLGPANADLKSAWEISEAIILAMRDEAAKHHAEFWLCTLDMPQQADPNPRERIKFQKQIGIDSLFRSNRLLEDFLTHAGIRHMSLAPALANYASQHNVVLHGFKDTPRNTGHYNEIGHRAAGQLIAGILRKQSSLMPGESLNALR